MQVENDMGTYTANYNLFVPSVGETGWGELVNGNFEIIDIALENLNSNTISLGNRISTLESGSFPTLNVDGDVTVHGNVTVNGSMIVDTPRVYNVTYGSSSFGHTCGGDSAAPIMVLPFSPTVVYTGSIYATRNYASNYSGTLYCLVGSDDTQYTIQTVSATMSSSATLNLPANCHGAWFGSSMGYTIRYPIFTST